MEIDFAEFEKTIIEKFNSSLNRDVEDKIGLANTIGMAAARVATLAIKEYHVRIQQNQVEQKGD